MEDITPVNSIFSETQNLQTYNGIPHTENYD